MVTTLLRSTLREIRQSLGRYLAILAIIALGVGFFAGLRMCQPSMLETGIVYLGEHDFYDFRLLSTLGFTEEDAAAFAALDGVNCARGSVYTEFLWKKAADDEVVLLAHALTDGVNTPELTAGRMPETGGECLGDANYFTEADLGMSLQVSDSNADDTRELLAYDTYTLVGLAESPLYLNYERGTASIGGGNVDAFVLLRPDGFDSDTFYDIYLKLADSADAYSDAYQQQIDTIKPQVEALLEERAALRYDTLYSDAMAEIQDGEEELADGWAEYRTERADAEQGLADAKADLEAGESDYADALAGYEQGQQDYTDGLQQYEDGMAQLQKAKAQLDDSKAQLDRAKTSLDEGRSSYEQLEALYASGAQLAQATGTGTPQQLIAVLRSGSSPQLSAAVDQALQPQGSSVQAFLAGWTAAEASIGQELNDAYLAALLAQLDQARAEYDSGLRQYEAGLTSWQAGMAELNDAKAGLDEAKKELDRAPGELVDARVKLDDGWKAYYDGLAEAEQEFVDAEQDLTHGEQELSDARQELSKLKAADTYTLTRMENTGYVCFDNDTSIVAAVSLVFPVFFFLVAALVCTTTMKRMVDEQRTQIGVLKALGYYKRQIIGKYLFYSGSAAVAGCLLGYALGSWGLPLIIWEIYGIMYGFAPLEFVFDPVLAVVSFLAALLCSMGATYLSCYLELAKPAAELLRPKTPKAGKRVFLEYITPLWRRMSFLRKVSIRNVLRYRSRLVMMILGIGGCTALLVTGFGIRDSIASIADDQYSKITLYDYAVYFQDPQTQREADSYLSELGWASDMGILVHSSSVDAFSDTGSHSTMLVIPAGGTVEGFLSLHSGERDIAFPGPGEAVLNTGLAEDLSVEVGDTVSLRSDDLGTLQVTVADTCDNYIFNYIFVAPESCIQQQAREPDYKTLFILAHPDADPYEESVRLTEGEGISSVTVNAADRDRVSSMLSRLDILIVVVVVCAAALAFIVLYNLTNINITERIREIATIKVLGFYQNEVASYVFREIIMLSVAGGLAGLLMGKALHAFVMAQVQVDGMFFPCQIKPLSYLISFALTMLFTWLITWSMRPRLRRIDMAESLKSIE